MSKQWMTYMINNQLLDDLDHQVYLLELAVVITKTFNIHCSHIDIVLSGTVCHIGNEIYCWLKGNYPSNLSHSASIYNKNNPKSTTLHCCLLYLGCQTDQHNIRILC